MKQIRRTHLEYGYRWSLVGNIIDEHLAGEDRKLVHGTKHFSLGTKGYVAPLQWEDGWENVIVIGKHRKQFRNVQMIIPSAYIENWRARKVYKPEILTIMETSNCSW